MKIEVSIGEVVDKYSILELKKKYIKNEKFIIDIEKELLELRDCISIINKYNNLYNILLYINEEIWNMTDKIKSLPINNSEYSIISYSIFEFNQKRFRIKNMLNILTDSSIKERKSYNPSHCNIIVDNKDLLHNKIAEIIFLSIEYDYISFKFLFPNNDINHDFFMPNIIDSNAYTITNSINLNELELIPKLKNIFCSKKQPEFGAFLQCHKQPFATYMSLSSFRNFYPNNTIVLISDNGYDYTEMAKHFNCIYIHCTDKANFNHKDLDSGSHIENSHKLIERFYNAYSLIKEEYVLLLEDDVIINKPVNHIFTADINGNCVNVFSNEIIEEFSKNYKHIDVSKKYYFSGAGGSIMHRSNMMKYMQNKEIINDILFNWKKYFLPIDICQDFLFSCIATLNNGTIDWCRETGDWFYGINPEIAVQHQFKQLYNVPLPQELQHLVKFDENMKLVVITFGGRECSLKILFPLIKKYKKYIHEYRIYVATIIQSDIDYMENFAKENSDFVKTIYVNINGEKMTNNSQKEEIWDKAYSDSQECDTVYLKLDDDIVYIDETLFTDFIQYRIKNRNAPLIYPLIINNLIHSCILQDNDIYNPQIKSNILHTWKYTYNRIRSHIIKNKNTKLRIGDFARQDEILCPISWGNLKYCYDLHSQFLNDIHENNIEKYYLKNNIVLSNAEPSSINVCSWIGEDLQKYIKEYGNIYRDEQWLAIYLPTWSGKYNEIYCKSVVSHYSYYRQRELGLDNTNILDRYYEFISKNM
jgi:hypothetical protein